jgi:hypothetical protein
MTDSTDRAEFPTRIGQPAVTGLAALLRGDAHAEPEQAEKHARRILETAEGIGYRHGVEVGHRQGLEAAANRQCTESA